MKKVASLVIIFILILAFSITAMAAGAPINEVDLVAEGTKTNASITGTVNSDSCVAVVAVLYDTDGTSILRTKSAPVQNDNTFSVTFDTLTLTPESSYSIKVADFAGGSWAVKGFTVHAHEHAYGNTWKYDTKSHWHECSCGDKSDTAAHSFGEWTQTKTATATENGSKERTCSVCGYKETAVITATGTMDRPATESPQTGDNSNVILWIALLFISGGVLGTLGVTSKKRRNHNKN